MSFPKKLSGHFKAILQQSRSPKINSLPRLTLMFSVQVGLHKRFEVQKKSLDGYRARVTVVLFS